MLLEFELYKLEILCPNYGQPLELCGAVHGNLPHFAGMRARSFLPPQERKAFPSRGSLWFGRTLPRREKKPARFPRSNKKRAG